MPAAYARYVTNGIVTTDSTEVSAMLLAEILPSVVPYSFSTIITTLPTGMAMRRNTR